LIAGVVVGGLGLLNALAGGHSENSNPIQIGIEGVVFVHAYINPVALFAVLQLVLLNKGIREKAEIDWLSKTPVLFGLVVTSIVAAFAFGLMTNGVSLDPQKASALVSIGHGGGAVLFISMMLMHALVVATVEESLFRGVIQSGLRELFGNRTDEKTAIWGAILTSNVMFGLVHYKLGIYWMIGAAIAGIGYGIVYELYKGRLSTVVAVHASVVLVITAVLQNG
jgi:membrane protease YdiL (CAAX protease family)